MSELNQSADADGIEHRAPIQDANAGDASSEAASSKEFADNLAKNVLEIFVVPEMNRRERAGRVPPGFELRAVQIVMEVDAAPEVRLNEEVTFAAYLRDGANPPVTGEVSSEELMAALPAVEHVGLAPDDRPNAGHITMVLTNAGWSIWFDLRYNGARILELVQAATTFLRAAEFAAEAGMPRPFVSNLFTSAELLAKARLLLHPTPGLLESRTHGMTHRLFNRETHLGNVAPQFSQLLNRLSNLINSARYSVERFTLPEGDIEAMKTVANEMLGEIKKGLPPRSLRSLHAWGNAR